MNPIRTGVKLCPPGGCLPGASGPPANPRQTARQHPCDILTSACAKQPVLHRTLPVPTPCKRARVKMSDLGVASAMFMGRTSTSAPQHGKDVRSRSRWHPPRISRRRIASEADARTAPWPDHDAGLCPREVNCSSCGQCDDPAGQITDAVHRAQTTMPWAKKTVTWSVLCTFRTPAMGRKKHGHDPYHPGNPAPSRVRENTETQDVVLLCCVRFGSRLTPYSHRCSTVPSPPGRRPRFCPM